MRRRSRTPNQDESYYKCEDGTRKELPQSTNAFFVKFVEVCPPHWIKILNLESYKGQTYPTNHIAYFESTMPLLNLDDARKYWLFFTTFKKDVRHTVCLNAKIAKKLTSSILDETRT